MIQNSDFKYKLNAVQPDMEYLLEQTRLTYEAVGMTIAQARLKELGDELTQSYLRE